MLWSQGSSRVNGESSNRAAAVWGCLCKGVHRYIDFFKGIRFLGANPKHSLCFYANVFRFTRIILRYTVHLHVEEEFQNPIPGFRTN